MFSFCMCTEKTTHTAWKIAIKLAKEELMFHNERGHPYANKISYDTINLLLNKVFTKAQQ